MVPRLFRTALVSAAMAVALGGAALLPGPAVAGDSGKPIVIALEAPLTGDQSSNGQDMLRGASPTFLDESLADAWNRVRTEATRSAPPPPG